MALDEFVRGQREMPGERGEVSVRQQDVATPAATGPATLAGEGFHGSGREFAAGHEDLAGAAEFDNLEFF